MLTLVIALCTIVLGSSIEFSITSSQCAGNGPFGPCNDTLGGGFCAFAPEVNKTWCCPASSEYCWNFGETCTGGDNVAGNGQILCTNEGDSWCCNVQYESCTPNTIQTDTCVANFANPYANMPVAEAFSIETAFLATVDSSTQPIPLALTAASTSPVQTTMALVSILSSIVGVETTLPSVSTLSSTAPVQLTLLLTLFSTTYVQSVLPSASTLSSTAPEQTSLFSTSTLPSSSNTSTESSSYSIPLSPGALAGIVIGAVVGVGLIAAASLLIGWRVLHKSYNRKNLVASGQTGIQERVVTKSHQDNRYGLAAKTEMSGLGFQRQEMQDTQSWIAEIQDMDAMELPGQF